MAISTISNGDSGASARASLNAAIAVANDSALLSSANVFTAGNTFASGAIAANAPALTITQTWNNAAVQFQLITADVTTTAADYGGTTFLNLKRNGTTVFRVDHGGTLNVGNGAAYIDTNGGKIQISSNWNFTVNGDTWLGRKAADTWRLGLDLAGVNNQMLTAASRITSDGVGANLTIAAGNGRGAAGGSLIFSYFTTAGAATIGTLTEAMRITTTGAIILAALPTSDPGVSGQLYKVAGAVMQSA